MLDSLREHDRALGRIEAQIAALTATMATLQSDMKDTRVTVSKIEPLAAAVALLTAEGQKTKVVVDKIEDESRFVLRLVKFGMWAVTPVGIAATSVWAAWPVITRAWANLLR